MIYEGFYKVYNKKAADRLGVVYTPNEIVNFMVESTDWLCRRHFGKALIDRGVEILDPATGTGSFICELMGYFRGQREKLAWKYKEELHANEVAILPYYVANLNIEATYAAITGQYAEFPNLCFVDTLDNVAALGKFSGHQEDLFGSVSEENIARIKRQNKKKISVVIGNPPYNANQLNENENNKNREYPEIDRRIKATYIEASTAQKTKLYDMYARFFRWASDRIDENGVLAFVSNSSFIESRTYDGFRKMVAKDFNEIWIVDLKGNARTSGESRRREGGNIFDDQIRVGIAVYFCVKKKGVKGCSIRYEAIRDYAKSDEKREFLQANPISGRQFAEIIPDEEGNWIKLADTDFKTLVPVLDKKTKATKIAGQERAIFKLFSLGVVTARDDWVYDFDPDALKKKVVTLITTYNADVRRIAASSKKGPVPETLDSSIKWTRAVKNDLRRKVEYRFDRRHIVEALYRPFVKASLYFDKHLNEMQYQLGSMFIGKPNPTIAFLCVSSPSFLAPMAIEQPFDYCFLKMGNGGTQSLPLWRYDEKGVRHDNITDWAVEQFEEHYRVELSAQKSITKHAIFCYVYAVFNDPVYQEKYALNLRREFPRIPLYRSFWKWAKWGEELMELHIGYETVKPWKLKRFDVPDEKSRNAKLAPKPALKADKDNGIIVLDSETQLTEVPAEVWAYRLGNRSAIEWILDQYKEKKPKDLTIREKFNTYRFADHKEKVIDLLMRVTRVSVETVGIVEAMKKEKR